jgi:hypothetical protein
VHVGDEKLIFPRYAVAISYINIIFGCQQRNAISEREKSLYQAMQIFNV